jgi:hypothetical protein
MLLNERSNWEPRLVEPRASIHDAIERLFLEAFGGQWENRTPAPGELPMRFRSEKGHSDGPKALDLQSFPRRHLIHGEDTWDRRIPCYTSRQMRA